MRVEIWFNGTDNQEAIMRGFPKVEEKSFDYDWDNKSLTFDTTTGHSFMINLNNVNFIEVMHNED